MNIDKNAWFIDRGMHHHNNSDISNEALNKFYAAMAATVTVVAVTVVVVNKTLPPAIHFRFKLPRTTIFY
ncbi:hypothetical protein C8322_12960 [Acinetobacter sp. SM1B]|nr:hypothetical protein C8322_12960 [Acinetobacter sp. SM1B]